MGSASQCLQLDGRRMWLHSTEAQMQTNSSAEGLIYRHLPSSLPTTPSVGKTFIDLYYSGDSWNPKKWMVEVSGRPTVLAVTQAAILCHIPTAVLPRPSQSRWDGAARDIVHSKHIKAHPTHLHLSNQRQQSPSGC